MQRKTKASLGLLAILCGSAIRYASKNIDLSSILHYGAASHSQNLEGSPPFDSKDNYNASSNNPASINSLTPIERMLNASPISSRAQENKVQLKSDKKEEPHDKINPQQADYSILEEVKLTFESFGKTKYSIGDFESMLEKIARNVKIDPDDTLPSVNDYYIGRFKGINDEFFFNFHIDDKKHHRSISLMEETRNGGSGIKDYTTVLTYNPDKIEVIMDYLLADGGRFLSLPGISPIIKIDGFRLLVIEDGTYLYAKSGKYEIPMEWSSNTNLRGYSAIYNKLTWARDYIKQGNPVKNPTYMDLLFMKSLQFR